jgi:hypothetical protein
MMKRYPLPDLLKGFAVFLIIPVHILEKFIDYAGRESAFGKVLLILGGPVAVPVFMMVMGYFIASSKKSLLQNILRGVLIFGLGILLNLGLNFHLLHNIWHDGWKLDPFQAIFGVDIFFLAGISIILLSVLKTVKKGQQWITLIFILFISGATSYFNEILLVTDRNYILPFIGGDYSWSYFPVFPWLTYPLIGFLFQKKETVLKEFIQRHLTLSFAILFSVFVLVVLFSEFGIQTTINLSDYYHHGLFFILWTLGVVILWVTLIRFVDLHFGDAPPIVFLKWLGQNITVFYIIQWLIIGNIATAIYQTQELSKFALWVIPIFLATLGLTLLKVKTLLVFRIRQVRSKFY